METTEAPDIPVQQIVEPGADLEKFSEHIKSVSDSELFQMKMRLGDHFEDQQHYTAVLEEQYPASARNPFRRRPTPNRRPRSSFRYSITPSSTTIPPTRSGKLRSTFTTAFEASSKTRSRSLIACAM